MTSENGFVLKDISAATFGKYQYCTKDKKTGLWYADSDLNRKSIGEVKTILPSPMQDTLELTEKARKLYEKAALEALPKTGFLESICDAFSGGAKRKAMRDAAIAQANADFRKYPAVFKFS